MEILHQYGLAQRLWTLNFQDTGLSMIREGISSWESVMLFMQDGLGAP